MQRGYEAWRPAINQSKSLLLIQITQYEDAVTNMNQELIGKQKQVRDFLLVGNVMLFEKHSNFMLLDNITFQFVKIASST